MEVAWVRAELKCPRRVTSAFLEKTGQAVTMQRGDMSTRHLAEEPWGNPGILSRIWHGDLAGGQERTEHTMSGHASGF